MKLYLEAFDGKFEFEMPFYFAGTTVPSTQPEDIPEDVPDEFKIVKRRHYLHYSESNERYESIEIPERDPDNIFSFLPENARFYYFLDKVQVITRRQKAVFSDHPSIIHPITSRIPGLIPESEAAILRRWENRKKLPVLPEDMKFVGKDGIMDCGNRPALPDMQPFYARSFDDLHGVFDSRDGLIVYRTGEKSVAANRAHALNQLELIG